MKSFTIEVVASSVRSCINAQRGGATRIELCSALATAGITPSNGLLTAVKKNVDLPVFVMIRPREGDFCYDQHEVDVMKMEIESLQKAGADGFVLGMLKSSGEIDHQLTTELVAFCKPYPVTFHRAIDCTPNLPEALEAIIDSGCVRVLTSGGKGTGPEGIEMIVQLEEQSSGRIAIMPGGGIRPDTFHSVLHKSISDYHLSGRLVVESPMPFKLFDMNWAETDEASIRQVVNEAEKFFS